MWDSARKQMATFQPGYRYSTRQECMCTIESARFHQFHRLTIQCKNSKYILKQFTTRYNVKIKIKVMRKRTIDW